MQNVRRQKAHCPEVRHDVKYIWSERNEVYGIARGSLVSAMARKQWRGVHVELSPRTTDKVTFYEAVKG